MYLLPSPLIFIYIRVDCKASLGVLEDEDIAGSGTSSRGVIKGHDHKRNELDPFEYSYISERLRVYDFGLLSEGRRLTVYRAPRCKQEACKSLSAGEIEKG
jgi:hypothetical protein